MRFLSDSSIREICPGQPDHFYQPMSLDFVLEEAYVYDSGVRKQTNDFMNKHPECEEPPDTFAKKYSGNESMVIEPFAFVEGFLNPDIIEKDRHYLWDLRSSRGRMGLSPHSQLLEEKNGHPMVCFFNYNPNTLRMRLGERFGQLFFCAKEEEVEDAYEVWNVEEAEELGKRVCDTPMMIGPYFIFRLGEKVREFKSDIGEIYIDNKPSDEALYNEAEVNKKYILNTYSSVIIQLDPSLDLPDDVGIRIFHSLPCSQRSGFLEPDPEQFFLQNHRVNAGWVDHGYKGHATAHPYFHKFPEEFYRGEPLAMALFVKNHDPVDRSYGSTDLGSHYQNSEGDVSRD